MINFVTLHEEGCPAPDNSQVWWDPEDGISMCHACGAVTEEYNSDDEERMEDL
jgi:transcription initiation factor TFIIIB Brf1 subunit/transcription initiation factor TFIIB